MINYIIYMYHFFNNFKIFIIIYYIIFKVFFNILISFDLISIDMILIYLIYS